MTRNPQKTQRSGWFRGTAELLACAATVLCCGCVNQAREVGLYREVLDHDEPKAEPLAPGAVLTLEHAFELTNANNEQIASQGETYLQTLIAKHRAFAAFLPTLSFQPDFTVEQAPRGTEAASVPGAPPTSAAAAAASEGGFVQDGGILRRFEAPVVGTMDFSYRSVPEFEAAKIAVAQQRQLLLDARATVLLNVAQTYYQVVISTKQVEVLRHSLELQQARLENIEGRYRVHLALQLDVAQAAADESATRVLLSHASNDMRNGRRTLALLIGVPTVDGPLVPGTLAPDPPLSLLGYIDRALTGRQDLLAAHNAVEEARYGVKAAVAEYYPSASLNVAGYLYREDFSDASKWNGILSANLPLFTAGAIRDDVRGAWSRLRQAALFESYLRREVEEGVRTAYDNLVTSTLVLNQLRREVASASDAYRQSIQLERSGLAIPLDVLTAQDTLLNSQLQLANESFNRTILQLDLIRAVGELDPSAPDRIHWADEDPMPPVPLPPPPEPGHPPVAVPPLT